MNRKDCTGGLNNWMDKLYSAGCCADALRREEQKAKGCGWDRKISQDSKKLRKIRDIGENETLIYSENG